MEGHPPTLGYARSPLPPAAWWPVVVPLVLATVGTTMFMCMCGHLDRGALFVTGPTAGIACYGWVSTTARYPWRLIHVTVVLLTAGLLAKNIADVLWMGHNPLLN